MKDQLLSKTIKDQDLQSVITTGHASISSTATDVDKNRADEASARMSQQDGAEFSSGNAADDYEGLLHMCENAKRRILKNIGADVQIYRRFACRRNRKDDPFVALGHDHLVSKYIFIFSNGYSEINGLNLRELNIDSRDLGTMKNEIKGIALFLISDQAILYIQDLAGAQWYLRVGVDCERLAVIFEYVAEAYGLSERASYVGYNLENFWQWTQKQFAWEKMLPNISCTESLLKLLEEFRLQEVHHE